MTTNMLQAISKMLEQQGTFEVVAFKERVKCAKLMLDKIIEGLNQDSASIPCDVELVKGEFPPSKEPEPKPKSQHQGQYQVVVDADQKLSKINGLPLDTQIIVDGKKMTYQQAIGKTFGKIKLPWVPTQLDG